MCGGGGNSGGGSRSNWRNRRGGSHSGKRNGRSTVDLGQDVTTQGKYNSRKTKSVLGDFFSDLLDNLKDLINKSPPKDKKPGPLDDIKSPAKYGFDATIGVLVDSMKPAADVRAKQQALEEAQAKPEDERTDYQQRMVDKENARLDALDKAMDQIPAWADPIIIDLDRDGVELVGLDKSSAFVDVDKDDYQENTGWAHQDDGILAIDLDGSGDVNDAAEFQFAGETNTDDTDMEAFRALYDSNDDGVFDANDSDWHKAGIWRDLNQNGRIAEYV